MQEHRVGDWVQIVATFHPWHGKQAQIVELADDYAIVTPWNGGGRYAFRLIRLPIVCGQRIPLVRGGSAPCVRYVGHEGDHAPPRLHVLEADR